MSPQFVILVPVKAPSIGKSRLVGVDDSHRRDLALAFALDTVTAALAAEPVEAVLVVTQDHDFAALAAGLGALVVDDADGLNASLRQAAVSARADFPLSVPVALCADLPALRSDDLASALRAIDPRVGGCVADAEGVGTTLYGAPYDLFTPAFGEGSRARHLASGVVEVLAGVPSLRRDVDDLGDLAEALSLGVGPHTRAVLDPW